MTRVLGVLDMALISVPAVAADEPQEGVRTEALAHRTEVAGAYSHSLGGNFAVRRGAGVRLAHHVSPVFAVGVEGTYYPDLGSGQWSRTRRDMTFNLPGISPEFMLVMGHAAGRVEFTPMTGALSAGMHPVSIGLYAALGFGIVHTRDDLRGLGCTGGGDCGEDVAINQVHPSTTLGVGIRVQRERLVGRLELRDVGYVENYDGIQLNVQRLLLTELSVGALLGRR